MRSSMRWRLVVLGLVAACSENTAPRPDQTSEPFSASKVGSGAGFRCEVEAIDISPEGINSVGDIAGTGFSWGGGNEDHAFLCDNKSGVTTDLGNLGQANTQATGLNAARQVVGVSTTTSGEGHAFLWSRGVMTDLGTLTGDDRSVAKAINDAGQVVGESSRSNPDGPPTSRAFLWDRGTMTNLGTLPGRTWAIVSGINARGQVVGTSGTISENARLNDRAFLWEHGRMTALPGLGGQESRASGINAAGEIVGNAQTRSGDWHGVVWRGGRVTDLGAMSATAINSAGIVVGTAEGGAVFRRNGVMILFRAEDPDFFPSPTAINAAGVVVGVDVLKLEGEPTLQPFVQTIRGRNGG